MPVDLVQRYKACMILGGVGDALGYRDGKWEFNNNGSSIHHELEQTFGNVNAIHFELSKWRVSDDTILHLAIAEALGDHGDQNPDPSLYTRTVKKLKLAVSDMKNRHPSSTTMTAIERLSAERENGWHIQYSAISHDCTAAVRCMCIGLRYFHPNNLNQLISVSIETSRMTHTHTNGYLSGLTTALFTSFALQQKPIYSWGKCLLDLLPYIKEYIQSLKRNDLEQNMRTWTMFETFWRQYLQERRIINGNHLPHFPEKYDVEERDIFYRELSHAGWAGASGTDSVAIAYDALLSCDGSWSELVLRGALHGGHGDATGAIACALYGAVYGFQNVPERNYKDLEYRDRLETVALRLYQLNKIHDISSTKTVPIRKSPSPASSSQKSNRTPLSELNQRGPCVHFLFIPAHVQDSMPTFQQSLHEPLLLFPKKYKFQEYDEISIHSNDSSSTINSLIKQSPIRTDILPSKENRTDRSLRTKSTVPPIPARKPVLPSTSSGGVLANMVFRGYTSSILKSDKNIEQSHQQRNSDYGNDCRKFIAKTYQ